MLSTLQFEWILLLICSILLLLVGCTVMPRPSSSASSTAQASMTFEIVPFFTETPASVSTRPAMTMTANISSEQITHRYTNTPPPLDVELPICYKRVNGAYSCFGKVWNRSENAVGGVFLKVEILDKSSQAVAEQDLSLEQNIIPNTTFASYRVLFDPFEGEKSTIRTTIMHQLPTLSSQSTLKIADERGLLMDSGRYRLTATIENDLDEAMDNIRVFATLMNPAGDIVGYRIYQVNGVMQPAARKAVDFEIIPLVHVSYITHVLHVEAHVEESEHENNTTGLQEIQP